MSSPLLSPTVSEDSSSLSMFEQFLLKVCLCSFLNWFLISRDDSSLGVKVKGDRDGGVGGVLGKVKIGGVGGLGALIVL